MSINNRIDKLEKKAAGSVGYLCIYYQDRQAEGYDVTPMGGGPSVHFATRQELDDFAALPGIDLTEIVIKYASKQQPATG